ncbi:MAG: pilus assembly FimT family protein [Planctomycetota bacterium]|jgi:type II secretory pathway pseudopilin PulG
MRRLELQRRFTLTEILVVVAIIALLAVMTIPALAPMIKERSVESAISNVQGAVYKARSLAAKANLTYSISFNTIDTYQHMLVIYDSDLSQTTGNVIDVPILLPEGAAFETNDGPYVSGKAFKISNGQCGSDAYLAISPMGETAGSGLTTAGAGIYCLTIVDRENPSVAVADKFDPTSDSSTIPDGFIFRLFRVLKLTGELYR